jgi:hypothetical protein
MDNVNELIGFSNQHITDQILGSLESPCVIYTNDKLRYSNKALNKLVDPNNIDSIFDVRDGFMKKLSEYSEDDPSKNVVSISSKKGRRVFKVLKSIINIDEILQKSTMYLFIDITLERYQKVKIESYNTVLESYLIKTKYSSKNKPSDDQPKQSQRKLKIDDEQNSILRKSHEYKTTAKEYNEELDDDVLSELQELDELDKEFAESIYMLKDDLNLDGINYMAENLKKYAHEISLLFEFKDLAYAIESLSNIFYEIDKTAIDEKNLKKIVALLEGVKDDLATWRKVLFIDKSAQDIHYLDSSLFSACLQIELLLSDDVSEMDSEEDDFELF